VGTEPLTLLASTQTGLKGTVAVEDLRGSVWVLSREGCGYRAVLKRTLEAADIPFIVAVEVLDVALQLQLIADGVGAGIMALRALPPLLEERGVQTFRLADMPAALEVWVFHRRHGPLLPVVMPLIHRTVATLLQEAVPVPQGRIQERHVASLQTDEVVLSAPASGRLLLLPCILWIAHASHHAERTPSRGTGTLRR
jgi:DNA-binding transcriptional LysR family regulator